MSNQARRFDFRLRLPRVRSDRFRRWNDWDRAAGRLASVIFVMIVAVIAASYLQADDLRKRKPLPKFLRSPKLAERYLSTRDVDELLQFELAEPVCLQLLHRDAVPEHARAEALAALAAARETDAVAELLPILAKLSDDDASEATVESVASLLLSQDVEQIRAHRDTISELAKTDTPTPILSAALIALTLADDSIESVWPLIDESPSQQLAFIHGLQWLPAGGPRAAIYDKLWPLATDGNSSDVQSAAIRVIGRLNIHPQDTFQVLAENVKSGEHVDASVAAICDISSQHWAPNQRLPLAQAILAHLSQTPLAKRTQPDGKRASKLVKAIAERIPSDQATEIEKELRRLTVREIKINAVEEQMAYDVTVLVVTAGQGLQIDFHNEDIMPHNLVIVDSPEAREEIGIAADRMQNEPDALAKGYLPESEHILHATKMIQPQQRATMTFEAPKSPGTYAYLCTFPGHWSKMYGAMIVVDDVDAFLASNDPLPTRDELLGIARVEWTFEKLAPQLASFEDGRSFKAGKRNFLKASCFSCHVMSGEGGKIGPELTKISETYKTPDELLKHVLNPTLKVDEKYAIVIIETDEGQVLRGTVVSETETTLRITENPLDTCNSIAIDKDSIEARTPSKLSPMPAGLLNTIVTPEGVLDLLAYLMSGGDAEAELFESSKD